MLTGLFQDSKKNPDGSYVEVGSDPSSAEFGIVLRGGTTGKVVRTKTAAIQQPTGDSRIFHLKFREPCVQKEYGSEERACAFEEVYKACGQAGLNPPRVIAVTRQTLEMELIDGHDVISFLTAAQKQGLLKNPHAVNVANRLTTRLLEDLVVFQFLELPVQASPCSYSSKLIESFTRLIDHYGISDRIFSGMGVSRDGLVAELDRIGKCLSQNAGYRMRDADLQNVMLDNEIITQLMGYQYCSAFEVLGMLNEGMITQDYAAFVLTRSIRHIDLDRADELSAGPDDFIRAISSVRGQHPFMDASYFCQAMGAYLGLISKHKGFEAAAKMGRSFNENYITAKFFLGIRRAGDLCPEYTQIMKELIEGSYKPCDEKYIEIVNRAVGVGNMIGMNFNTAANASSALGGNLESFFRHSKAPFLTRDNVVRNLQAYQPD
ncbi:hypothetical protein HYU11_00525 [Candidatus Woesearchaeota archaeon]|nr:hypothetical protein [Candidatus Woesearchaeota archaeon]